MKLYLFSIFLISAFALTGQSLDQVQDIHIEVNEEDNTLFTNDKIWRGADGAASIDLENGNALWLFSDTFIDTQATGKRINAKMINNSIAIQEGYDLELAKISNGPITSHGCSVHIDTSCFLRTGNIQ